nr:MAG TPA: Rep protein [Circoviridae sp.]
MLPMKGTYDQNVTYCTKEDNDPFERGEWTDNQGKRTDLCKVRNLAYNEGMRALFNNKDVCKNNNHAQFAKNFLTYCEPERDIDPDGIEIIWIWGESGSGKTKLAQTMVGDDCYRKTTHDHWFDGYDRHECILLDELRPTDLKFAELCHVLDIYPFRVANKGGFRQCHATKIIATTIFSPEQFMKLVNRAEDTNEPTYQLERRLSRVIHVVPDVREVQKGNTKLSAQNKIPYNKQEM